MSPRLPRVAGALLAIALAFAAQASALSRGRIYVEDGFDGSQFKPGGQTIVGAGGDSIGRLRWKHWGSKRAVGHGTWYEGDGRTGRFPIVIALTRPKWCKANAVLPVSARFYQQRTIIFTHGVAHGWKRTERTPMFCPEVLKAPPGIIDSDAPADVPGLTSGVAQVSSGWVQACALTTDGAVECWGWNTYGGLGDRTRTTRRNPVRVQGLTEPTASVATGDQFACALSTTGAVSCWGDNRAGQLGDASKTSRAVAGPVSGLDSGVTAIAAGADHACALLTDGTVKCWGSNDSGQIGDGTTVLRAVPVAVSGLSGVTAIDAGTSYTCALTSGGGVKCWGYDKNGQLGNGSTRDAHTPVDVVGLQTGVSSVSTGAFHACALMSDGSVKCWGANDDRELGDGTTRMRTAPVAVAGLAEPMTAMSAGDFHNCALGRSGRLWCWGDNFKGELGDGTEQERLGPVEVRDAAGVVSAVSPGGGFTCMVTTAGGAKCWGGLEYV